MTVLRRDTHHYTYADYLTWPDSRNDELINGVACVREPPAPLLLHQGFVVALCGQIAMALEDKPWHLYVAPADVLLPKATEEDEQIDTVVQPDVFIVRDLHKLGARRVRGAPDWIAEVLSPSTAGYDRTVKLRVYERARVPEVWLVNPVDRTMTVHQLDAGSYGRGSILELKGRTSLNAVPGVAIDWDRVIARML